ncbi:MAG: pyridoxal-dependent decarboxylase [Acidobacteriota bacterium]
MSEPEQLRHLAWFLGPKAENGQIMEDLLLEVLRDYFHWRKNYFPSDPILVTPSLQREFGAEQDALKQRLDELMAALRRNFPFYSPRYMGHMLSDTSMASTLGFIAGLMFNPNNVTPEAAPVTTELEIDACNAVLAMLGYQPPPEPPPPGEDARKYYERAARGEFGWAHITSGGTVANIEALWIARQVRYFPLSVREVARAKNLEIPVHLADGSRHDIRELDPYRLLLIKPAEAIYLLPRYIQALRKHEKPRDPLWKTAWQYLNETEYALAAGAGPCLGAFPAAILAAGSRHYSIAKAADIIGIGQRNIVSVKTDASFRIDVDDLRRAILRLLDEKRVPLCVVATAGTTEEGAVDPVHKIVELRAELEASHQVSFWLHLDAAWGGFIRTLFCPDGAERAAVTPRVHEEVRIEAGKRFRLSWPSPEVGSAFASFPEADSITVDPHKMGYTPYPSGCVAFRDDRVRLFVLQRAPYVTSSALDPLLHTPPRHRQIEGGEGRIIIDSFSPFILEGSKPGAAAAALWLSVQTIPLTPRGHGLIVKESVLAARELYEWLTRWDTLAGGKDHPTEFVPLTPEQPDTNIVCFVVKKKGSHSLAALNRLTELVYKDFTILSELGEREYSYGQSFFLTHTRMQPPEYPAEGLFSFFERCGLSPSARAEYEREGVTILRACVMNPYIRASRIVRGEDFTRTLVEELHQAAQKHVHDI